MDSKPGEAGTEFWHLPGPFFVISGHVKAWVGSAQLFQQNQSAFQGDLVVGDVSAKEDQVRVLTVNGVQENLLAWTVKGAVQVGDQSQGDGGRKFGGSPGVGGDG